MRPIIHLISSSILAIIIFIFTKSITASAIIILVGVFFDLDHLIDFWALKPENAFNIKDFLDSEKYNKQAKYMFVLLHAYEWIIALWIIHYFSHFSAPYSRS